jgi:tetratricopeptide (TPR) repeat protein
MMPRDEWTMCCGVGTSVAPVRAQTEILRVGTVGPDHSSKASMRRPLRGTGRREAVKRSFATTVLFVVAACAGGAPPVLPTPGQIPALEARHRAAPGDREALLRLAAAYQQAGRAADAVTLLEPAVARDGGDAAAAYQLGVAYEDLERFADARRLYGQYVRSAGSAELRRRVEGRLALLDRRELEAAARSALAREQELAATQPAPQTVGVFPFLSTTNAELTPLGKALAELLTTDLSQTARLRVVERARIQLLLDELALAESGRVDPATASRTGRLLGAGRIVQGRIDGSEGALRIQALVVPVPTAEIDATPIAQEGALARFFDMQSSLALELYRRLGIELTVAERERVAARPTENVQALLAFGFGLDAEDGGDWTAAIGHFRRAVDLDPGFAEARDHLSRAQSAATAAQDTPEELALFAPLEWDDVASWIRRRQRFAGVDRMIPTPDGRDPTSEILGLEGLERGILIDLIIRRPASSR